MHRVRREYVVHMEIDPSKYREPAEIAARLGLSAETVRRWARQGRIPAVRTPGGRWLIHRDALKLDATGGDPETTLE